METYIKMNPTWFYLAGSILFLIGSIVALLK